MEQAYNYTALTNAEKEAEGIFINWDMMQYTNAYNTVQFVEQKFARGYENIPGFEKVIEKMAEKNAKNSPLAEYNIRTNIQEDE